MIRLDVASRAVWSHTLAALRASATVSPTLKIRCKRCGDELALVGVVPGYGPMFTSSWAVPADSSIAVDGKPTTRRKLLREITRSGAVVTGNTEPDERHGVIALLALPPEMEQEYPPLMVRCAEHGDGLLDRHEVLAWLHAGKRRQEVDVKGRLAYEPPRTDRGTDRSTVSTTFTFGRPIDDPPQ